MTSFDRKWPTSKIWGIFSCQDCSADCRWQASSLRPCLPLATPPFSRQRHPTWHPPAPSTFPPIIAPNNNTCTSIPGWQMGGRGQLEGWHVTSLPDCFGMVPRKPWWWGTDDDWHFERPAVGPFVSVPPGSKRNQLMALLINLVAITRCFTCIRLISENNRRNQNSLD